MNSRVFIILNIFVIFLLEIFWLFLYNLASKFPVPKARFPFKRTQRTQHKRLCDACVA